MAAVVLAAVLALIAVARFGTGVRLWSIVPLLVALATAAVMDACGRVIPDRVSLPALAYALLLGIPEGRPSGALAGAIIAGGVVFLAALVTRGGFGGGDIKLMAALGAVLGWRCGLVALASSQVLGATIAIALLLSRNAQRRTALPIGCAMALIGAVFLLARP